MDDLGPNRSKCTKAQTNWLFVIPACTFPGQNGIAALDTSVILTYVYWMIMSGNRSKKAYDPRKRKVGGFIDKMGPP